MAKAELSGEVKRPIGAAPVKHPVDARLDDRHLGAQHVHEGAVEDRRDLDRRTVSTGHELAP
jgi:hypothetical protein